MITRYWVKDKNLMDTLQGIDSNIVWYNIPQTIQCPDWDSLTLLKQTTITSDVNLAGYQFDHDETV